MLDITDFSPEINVKFDTAEFDTNGRDLGRVLLTGVHGEVRFKLPYLDIYTRFSGFDSYRSGLYFFMDGLKYSMQAREVNTQVDSASREWHFRVPVFDIKIELVALPYADPVIPGRRLKF